jgi:hypothetical protein
VKIFQGNPDYMHRLIDCFIAVIIVERIYSKKSKFFAGFEGSKKP